MPPRLRSDRMFDWLIVGAGFAGSVLAERLATERDESVLLIDRRNHIGGNAYDRYDDNGLLIHQYGPHIFHTNSERVFDYLSRLPSGAPTSIACWRRSTVSCADSDQSRYGQQALRTEPDLRAAGGFFADRGRDRATNQDVRRCGREPRRPGALREVLPGLYPQAVGPRSLRARRVRHGAGADPHEPGRPLFHGRFQFMPLHGYTRMFERMLDHPNIM